MSNLRHILDDWAPDMHVWSCRIEVDDEGNWWLTQDGKRRTYSRWRPADEMAAFSVVALLYMLNEAGETPLPDAIAAKASKRDQDALRRNFKSRGFSILIHHLLR
ncbi:hypothetical protein ACWEJ6_52650 [Nonomuraea sp. NPDC004702]